MKVNGSSHLGSADPALHRSVEGVEVVLDESALRARIIEPEQFVADTAAFVDVRLPRSAGKASYSFIGPGVSQNPDQTVNITEPHGFNIGAASMPNGVVNNPHLHFTAEVFVCTAGRWRFDVGADGGQSLEVGPGSVFSVPTWVFRGFENIGPDDGWLFTVLGRDETGGILWSPSVLEQAAATGMYLNRDSTVVDTTRGDEPNDVLSPLTVSDLANVDRYDDEELARLLVGWDDLAWSETALLSCVLDGHRCEVAPVIGHGMSESRHSRPPIVGRHGFSVEWLRVGPGSSVGVHRHHDNQVLFVVGRGCEMRLNRGADTISSAVVQGSVVSIPPGAWRDIVNVGSDDLEVVVVNGGDGPTVLEWDPRILSECRDAGWTRDANGCVAPVSLVG